MKKKISVLMCALCGVTILSGCENSKNNFAIKKKEENVLYEYVTGDSADAQLETVLGLAVEQPVFNEKNETIGKRLFVESDRDKIDKGSLIQFYSEISKYIDNYKEIVVSLNNGKAVQIFVETKEVWYCSIDENMTLIKEKKISY